MAINPAVIFSVLGNQNSLVPLALKDISATSGMTAGSFVTGKEEGVDRFIDEAGTEVIWLFGIPAFKWIFDKVVFKAYGLDSKFDPRNLKNGDLFEKVKEYAPDDKIRGEIEKISGRQKLFKNLSMLRFGVSTALTVLTYFGLTKLKQKYTEKKIRANLIAEYEAKTYQKPERQGEVTFKGGGKFIESLAFSPVRNMWVLDGCITTERLANSRTPQEFTGYAIKEASTLCFMYWAGGKIQAWAEKHAKNKFDKSIGLDVRVLENCSLRKAFEDGTVVKGLEEFNFVRESDTALYEFLHKNSDNIVVDVLKKSEVIKLYEGTERIDTRKYIDLDEAQCVSDKIRELYEQYKRAAADGETAEKFFSGVKRLKRGAILLNIGSCIFALGVVTPALMLAKRFFGKDDTEFQTKREIREKLINEGVIA